MQIVVGSITNNQIIEVFEYLIQHALKLEYEADLIAGLGNDAGSGYSVAICNAETAVKALKERLKNA